MQAVALLVPVTEASTSRKYVQTGRQEKAVKILGMRAHLPSTAQTCLEHVSTVRVCLQPEITLMCTGHFCSVEGELVIQARPIV